MRTEYGKWSAGTSVHAVGYDGKWLCGRSGRTSTECSENMDWVDCKLCLKKLPEYIKKYIMTTSTIDNLKEALRCAKAMADRGRGKDATCAVDGLNEKASLYIESWMIPAIEKIIKHFDEVK